MAIFCWPVIDTGSACRGSLDPTAERLIIQARRPNLADPSPSDRTDMAARARVSAVQGSPSRRGLTATEILTTLVMMSVLVILVSVAIARAKKMNTSAACAANLRSIGLALVSYAHDNGGVLPYMPDGTQWENRLLRYIERKTFRCSGDQELYPALGSSYDWRDTGPPDPQHPSTLAGKHYAGITRLNAAMAYEALPGWHKPRTILVVQVDLVVQAMDQQAFIENLTLPVQH